ISSAAYRIIGDDRAALARAMRYDDELVINLAGLRLVQRLDDADLSAEVLPWCAAQHPNEYIRARALRQMERRDMPEVRAMCLAALDSPYWVLRLEAADILSRIAAPADAERLREARDRTEDEWLRMALTDALCRAEGRDTPPRVRLNLAEREHTEGGDTPRGFQVWLGRMPNDPDAARRLVEAGYRFGAKTRPANMPAGMVLNAYNRSAAARNTYLLDSVLAPLEKWEDKLPYLYYIALFDEPGSLGTGYHPVRVRAMLLEAGRSDLLPLTHRGGGGDLAAALPEELRRAYVWYNARFGGVASNWVVHMFRLTAQRKYPDLRIFPQSLSYMRRATRDAFDVLDADGDYNWMYHYGNFFRDGTVGAVNRVINPGEPINTITWMGWWKPNVINGNTLYADTEFPDGPWRLRDYMGTRSALALWATGTEPGFFDRIGMGKASDRKAGGKGMGAFTLKPWSDQAEQAVACMMDDPAYWRKIEGKLAVEQHEAAGGQSGTTEHMLGDDGADDDGPGGLTLEDEADPLEEALAEAKASTRETLMTGISYMNIFNTDTTRVLSSLPKPDTRRRSTLIILGRDYPYYADGAHFPIPAIAVVGGYDMAPTYDTVARADLAGYDTILLRACRDGVTAPLVRKVNRWLREKDGGLLVVWGDVTSDNVQFPMLARERIDQPLLWEDAVDVRVADRVEEAYKDRRGRDRTRRVAPKLKALRTAGAGKAVEDAETRVHATIAGDVTPLVTTSDGEAVLARWNAPESVTSVVLFDGATAAGPAYTGALERIIRELDRERGSDVARNRWWGHTIYENDRFVVDVATSGLRSLHEARPRRHEGVDAITGVINPEVRHGQCAVVLKDYVGPYAGARGDWAVLAREALKGMTVESEGRLRVDAEGVTRVTHIGPERIRLTGAAAFERVDNQVHVWKLMRAGRQAYSILRIDGGWEMNVYASEPFVVETAK
ncbi:MAG: HEAT repeat domain-containing protein, partial [Planctomycetota bacterium]